MKYLFLSFLTLLLSINFASAQIGQGGTPVSFNKSLHSLIQKNIPVMAMTAIDLERLTTEDIINDHNKEIPWRFGENISVNIDIKINGVYDLLPNGDKLWRIRVYAAGAYTLNFTFDNYELPDLAKLYIYNEQKTNVLGAFTSFNNQADKIFATTLIEGESVIIEYYEPKNVDFSGTLHLSRITHGYRNVYDFTAKSFGSSGSCNNNVVCPEAAGWENQIRSACILVVNSSGFCSGSLVNNTANDGTPYVMTANHCSTSNNFGSWIFWFNWQSPTCTNPTTNPPHDQVTTSGCVLKARNAGSDFCLVQMNQAPPQSFNVYYAGWSREGTVSQSATGIHHPNGDIKKISFANNPTVSAVYNSVDSWQALWTDGATEPGSSGSPLYDINYRFIGQLYGGPSACGATPANMNDYYGKFSVSWDGANSATRLNDWLDPLGTSPLVIDGYDPTAPVYAIDAKPFSIVVPTLSYCAVQVVTPKVIIQNNGTSNLTNLIVKYNINGGTFVQQTWSGNLATNDTTCITFPPLTLTTGDQIFSVITTNPNILQDENTTNDTLNKIFSVTIGIGIPFSENFEGTLFPPQGWTIGNPDGSTTWTRNTNAGGNGTSTAAAFINLVNYTVSGQFDNLISPKINLTTVNNAQLTFKIAYRRYSIQYADELKVLVSSDCGATFTTIYNKAGTNLSTGSDLTQAFFPTQPADWRLETVDLTPYAGNTIIIQFQTVNHNGNNIFIDDINFISDMPPTANFSAISTTSCTGVIQFSNFSAGIPTSILWDFGDGTTDTTFNPVHSYLHDGIYNVTLSVLNPYGNDQLIRTNYININLPDLPVGFSSSRCDTGSVTLSASGSGLLYWYDSPTGENALDTGNNFNTHTLLSTTPFYVENHDEQPSIYFGDTDTTTNGGNGNFNAEYWLTFDCFEPIRLVSVLVNAGSSGQRIITLRDDLGNNLDSVTVDIPAGVSRVLLDFNIQPGSYQLVGPKNANLWRNNQNITYPYTIPDMISITGSNVTNRYYYFYKWEVKGPDCISARLPVTAYIYPSLSGGMASIENPAICTGETTILNLTNHQGDIQWQTSSDGINNWTDITSGNGIHDSIFETNPLYYEVFFRAKLSGNGCSDIFSNTVHLSILPGPVAGFIVADDTSICSSGGVVNLNLSGNTGNIQWQQSLNGVTNWYDIVNATYSNYTYSSLTENIFYRTILSYESCPDAITNIISIIVNAAPQAGQLSAAPADICTGSTTTISMYSYFGDIQWQHLTSNSIWESIAGASNSNYTTPSLLDTTSFRVLLSAPGCDEIISDSINIYIHFSPSVTIATNNASYGLNNGTATVNALGGTGIYSYQWDVATGSQVSQTATNLSVGTYFVTVSDGICTYTASCNIQENPSNYPVANFSTQQQLICIGSSVNFTDLSGNNPDSWSWIFPGASPSFSNSQDPTVIYNISGVFNVTLIATNIYGTDTIIKPYYIMVTNPGTLTFNTTPESISGIFDGSATAIVSGGNPPYNFYWNNGGNTQTISELQAGNYSVAVIDASGCFITGPVTVNLLTSLTELLNESNFLLYPNPASDFVNIKNLTAFDNYSIEITDVLGNFIAENSFNQIISKINLTDFSNGIYFIKIKTDRANSIYKIILAK